MRFLSLAMLAAGTIAVASPVLAQPDNRDQGRGSGYDQGRNDRGRDDRGRDDRGRDNHGRDDGAHGWNLDRRIDWMQRRIDRGRDDGSLDRREAYRAQRALEDIRRDKRRMEWRGGGSMRGDQRDELQARLDRLNGQIRWLRHNDEVRPW